MSFEILVVDDEEAMRESLAAWLKKEGYGVQTAGSGPEALEMLEDGRISLILIDLKMPGMDGLELLDRIKTQKPPIMSVIMTAYGSIESAVQAMKQGASDYLLKPFDPEHLVLLIAKLSEQKALLDENERLRARLAERDKIWLEDLMGQSNEMKAVFLAIEDVAQTDAPVLITGETGTGKELVARAIHARSQRSLGPFVAINCGAMSETLLESELFGHERGAFTGAVQARRGRIELAHQGVLFLDEVGEISAPMQVNLLRILEQKTFFRLGGQREVQSDFRLISATHRNLKASIDAGGFRQDFFYRINVIQITVPPLRQRPEDIPLLAWYFLDRFGKEMGKPMEGFSAEALDILKTYPWPGNVRELRNVIERAVVVSRGPTVNAEGLTFLRPEKEPMPPGATLAELEAGHIKQTLLAAQGNISQAAKRLGIDRGTLARKIKKHGLEKSC